MPSRRKGRSIALKLWQLSLNWVTDRKPQSTQQIRRPRSSASDPALKEIWCQLIDQYFTEKQELKDYRVYWSARNQRRTLASCNIIGKRVVVASELNHDEHRCWLEPLLYHELCHAAIGLDVQRYGRKRAWHGREFRTLEQRHPQIAAMDNWIKLGGFSRAVRAARTRNMWQQRNRVSSL